MHSHLEIILPPQPDGGVEKAVEKIMQSFVYEEGGTADWWDYWRIGGRWSGQHLISRVTPKALSDFSQVLADRKVTVSGVQFGKPTLQPSSQIPEVDRLWRRLVPNGGDECPLFDHAHSIQDICTINQLGRHLEADRLIICDGILRVARMVCAELYNGREVQKTTWDGYVLPFLEDQVTTPPHSYPPPIAVTPEWIAVTVDYHN
jgi:hypothetical protein